MHEGQIDIDKDLVARLLAAQFPELRAMPITRVASTGTVNALFRIGDGLCARLPLVEDWAEDIARELKWLPQLSQHLTLQIPQPYAEGAATAFYPFPWAIYRWIDGEPYADAQIDDETAAAVTLARFVRELRAVEPTDDAPRGGRDPLDALDKDTRAAIDASSAVIDRDAAMAMWERSLEAPSWNGDTTWIHSDLLRPNLLVARGRLGAVIDFGGAGVGDPATDVIPAWTVFGPGGREAFRATLEVDDGTWARARGIALHQAAMIIPYYRETNPGFVTLAQRTTEQILADLRSTPRSSVGRVTAFGLREGPVHVLDDDDAPLPGHYEIDVWPPDGGPRRRFLTDKGRAAMLRLMDDGRREISDEELHDLTTEPDLATLLARMDREAGEGA